MLTEEYFDQCYTAGLGTLRPGAAYKAAIVVQGSYFPEWSPTIFSEFSEKNRDILIICATYQGCDVGGSQVEKLLINAGILVLRLVNQPSKNDYLEFWETNNANQNLQRLSSFMGLDLARQLGIKYSLKIRSDTFLGKPDVINYLIDQVNKYPLHKDLVGKMKSRIVISGQGTITKPFMAPFHVRDHWYFGHTEDLVKFFDISSKSSWAKGAGIAKSCPESALTCVWMKDLGIEARDTTDLIRKAFIIEDAPEIEQVRVTVTPYWSLEYRRYKTEGIPYLRTVYSTADYPDHVTTKTEWEGLLSADD